MAQFSKINCRRILAKNFPDLSKDKIEEIVSEFEGFADRGNPSVEIKRAARDQAEELRRQAPHEQANARRSVLAMKRDSVRFDAAASDPGLNLFQEIEAYFVGSTSGRPGSLDSIDLHQKSTVKEFVGRILADLEDADHKNIRKRYRNRKFGEDVARAMRGEKVLDPDAIHAAKVFEKWKDELRLRANRAGARIGKLPGHVIVQSHNMLKIKKAGFLRWKGAVIGLLDHRETFGSTDPDVFLQRVYENIVTGQHSAVKSGDSGLAAGLGRERVLHFADADSFIKYNNEFGNRDIISGLLNGVVKLAEDTALMERMTHDPDAHFRNIMAKYQDRLKTEGGPKSKIMRFGAGPEAALGNRYDQLTRASSMPVNPHLAYWAQGLRNLNNLTQMGQVMLSSLPDIAGRAANAHVNGINFFSGYARIFADLASGPLTPAKKEQFRLLGVYFQGVLNDTAARIMPVDGAPGALAGWSNTMFKYNLLNWWTDRMDGGHAWMLSDNLAKHSNSAFDFLPVKLRKSLELYGINEADWSVMRKSVVDFEDGARLMTGDGVRAQGGTEAQAQKLTGYFIGEADSAVPKPGARERAIVLQGLRSGTPAGEAARMALQFKMFSVTMLTKVWPRIMDDGMPGFLHLSLMMTLMGYGAMTSKDLIRGKGPRDHTDPKTWVQAALAGGGLGILGDILLEDYLEYGTSFAEVLAGPSVSRIGDVARLPSRVAGAIAGGPKEARDAGVATFNTAMRQVPFANMFYTRAAVDYLWTYQIQELINPGYLGRIERRMRSKGRQDFLVRPSSIVPRGGVFRQ